MLRAGFLHCGSGASSFPPFAKSKPVNVTLATSGGFQRLWCSSRPRTINITLCRPRVNPSASFTVGATSASCHFPSSIRQAIVGNEP